MVMFAGAGIFTGHSLLTLLVIGEMLGYKPLGWVLFGVGVGVFLALLLTEASKGVTSHIDRARKVNVDWIRSDSNMGLASAAVSTVGIILISGFLFYIS